MEEVKEGNREFIELQDKENLLPKFKRFLEILQIEISDPETLDKVKRALQQINIEINKIGQPELREGTPGKYEAEEKVEVEDKYEVGDIEGFKKQALEQNFSLGKEIVQEDIYCDIGDLLRQKDQDLRIRKILDEKGHFISGELKWEGIRGQIQDRPVFEIKVGIEADLKKLEEVLKSSIRMEEFTQFFKKRFFYQRKEKTGRTTEIELDDFSDQNNPERIRGRIFAQFAQEVEPDERDRALKEVQEIAASFNLKRENRDYTEIAAGLKRKE